MPRKRKSLFWERTKLPPKRNPPFRYNPFGSIKPQSLPQQLKQQLQINQNLFGRAYSHGRSAASVGSMSTKKNVPMFVDYAPTSKGKCFKCRVRIIKGSPRGWYYDKMTLKGGQVPKSSKWASGNIMTVKRLLCFECVLEHLKITRLSYRRQVRDYTTNIKRIKRMAKMKKAGRALDTQRLMTAMEEAPTL